MKQDYYPSPASLQKILKLKHGRLDVVGWSPSLRIKHNYHLPGEVYESLVYELVDKGTTWIDVGGGSSLFPNNRRLSEELSGRASRLVAVDPSDNVHLNEFADETVQSFLEDFETSELFTLATLRMVAEHVEAPASFANALSRIVVRDGLVVVYTINKYCPIPLVTRLVPFNLHFKIKKMFWGGESSDTFPVCYQMNTRKKLNSVMCESGFVEVGFEYLDDISASINYRLLHKIEIKLRAVMRKLGFRYFENNLLGVYRKI